MIKKIAIIAVTLTTTSSLRAQSSADGTWDFTMASPFGSVDATVTMKTDGNKLSGEFDLGEGRKLTIEEGSIQGNTISFRITREGAMTMIYEMSADIDGNSISGTAAAMGTTAPWSMSRDS